MSNIEEKPQVAIPADGVRIKFVKRDHLLYSHKIYSNGEKMVRLVIDTEQKIWKLLDPVDGSVVLTGGQGLTNLEVVQRNGKKALQKYLNIKFEKEVRKDEEAE